MWQQYECLYNPKDTFYHNKHARYDALNKIAEKLKNPNFDVGATEIKVRFIICRNKKCKWVCKVFYTYKPVERCGL